MAGLWVVLLYTPLALLFVLSLGVRNGLPLPVARCIGTLAGNRDDVVDYVALAGPFG